MKTDWEIIKRGDVMPQYAGLHVTLNPAGDIVMSRVTWEAVGRPGAFLLMWDGRARRIGLLRTELENENAYPVRVANNRTGSKLVRGHRLLREKQIDLPQTMQFKDARLDEDGVLVLDLETAVESKRARARNRSQNSELRSQ